MAVGLVYFTRIARGTKLVTRIRGVAMRNELKGVLHCGSPGFVLFSTPGDVPAPPGSEALAKLRDMHAKLLTYDTKATTDLGIDLNLALAFTNRRGLRRSISLDNFRAIAAEHNVGGDVPAWMDARMERHHLSYVLPLGSWRRKAPLEFPRVGLVTKYTFADPPDLAARFGSEQARLEYRGFLAAQDRAAAAGGAAVGVPLPAIFTPAPGEPRPPKHKAEREPREERSDRKTRMYGVEPGMPGPARPNLVRREHDSQRHEHHAPRRAPYEVPLRELGPPKSVVRPAMGDARPRPRPGTDRDPKLRADSAFREERFGPPAQRSLFTPASAVRRD